MWEAVEELPTQDQNAVIGAICRLAFTGEQTELEGTSKYIFIAFRERVLKLCKRHKDNIMQTSCKHNVNIKEKKEEKEKKQKKKIESKEKCVCNSKSLYNNKLNNNIYINNNNELDTSIRISNTDLIEGTPTLSQEFDTLPNSKAKPANIEEVQIYIDQRGITSFTAQEWWDFYASKGWKIGRETMKDWKAAVRTWQYRKDPHEQPTQTEEVEDDFDRLARGEMPILRR